MSGARDVVLGRIRRALADVPADEQPPDVPVERAYRRHAALEGDVLAALFVERVGEYRATVHRCAPDRIAATAGRICADAGAATMIVPADAPAAWRPADVAVIEDAGHTPEQLDAIDAVLTGCATGVAETGTIVLDGGRAQGRRALTLVPDVHLCVVTADQIVELVPEAVAALDDAVTAGRALTWISGPSATSDIELSRVEGVHGPRHLHVLLVT